MKKLIIVLVAAYIGVLAYMYYQKVKTNRIWNDPKWEYCLKVLYNNDFSKPFFDTFHPKWKRNITVEILGKPKREDRETIEKVVKQLNELIAPVKIRVNQDSARQIKRVVHEGTIFIYFQKKEEHIFQYNRFRCDSTSSIIFFNTATTTTTLKESITRFESHSAQLNIWTDTTEQNKRNNLLLKGLTYAILCYYDQPQNEYFHLLDTDGHIHGVSLTDPRFPNSIFNTSGNNCNELDDVDKFIINAFYSKEVERIISENSFNNYLKRYNVIYYMSIFLLFIALVAIYFSGFLHSSIFAFIDNRIKIKWFAFNCKVFSLFLFFTIGFIIINIGNPYIGLYNRVTENAPNVMVYSIFYILQLLFAYMLILVNFVYIIEKILFPRFEQFAEQQLFSFMSLILGILLVIYISRWIKFSFYIGNLQVSMNFGEKYTIAGYIISALGIIRFLYNYSNYQKKLAVIDKEQELIQLRELKTRAELNALQSKINPHFLYNALNSIAGLAHQNADKVEHMALALSKLFRYSINKEEDDFATVQSEVEMVTIYLDIEKVRFGEKLEYSLNVAPEVEQERIPKFILQPLVENAIKHGLSQITGTGRLVVEIFKTGSNLCIRVSDNGPDFPNDMMTGYGLQNIYEKLDILYPRRYEVTLQNGECKNISVILKH